MNKFVVAYVLGAFVICAFAFQCAPESLPPKLFTDSTAIFHQQLIGRDSIIEMYKDSLFKSRHTLADFNNRFKLAKIQRYLDICAKRPANKVYFYGWIKRTMTE